jgi:hypothetical protein
MHKFFIILFSKQTFAAPPVSLMSSSKGLFPASNFSTRFFNPINKILETYSANRASIKGDAITLFLNISRFQSSGFQLLEPAAIQKTCW